MVSSQQTAKNERPQASQLKPFKIYSHSTLLYWWVIWAYGAFASLLTYAQGKPIDLGSGKATLVHPSPWVGISYIALLIFVILFTSVKLRTLQTLLIAMVLLPFAIGVEWLFGWKGFSEATNRLVIHMNLAFYTLTSGAIFSLWLAVVFGVDRLSYWRVAPGYIEEKHWADSMDERTYPTSGAVIRRERDDFFRHKILGLGILGFGTGNLIFMPSGDSGPRIVIENVWRVSQKRDRAQAYFHLMPVVSQ